MSESNLALSLQPHCRPLRNSADLDPLMDLIGDARFVLLGEASHGTHEYYTWRMQISKRLIEEKGFSFIAVEGDWPDCYEVNRFVKCYDKRYSISELLMKNFSRWPSWMWANWEIAALAEWLRQRNKHLAPEHRTGFYGLDMYSLWESMESILHYLQKNGHPEALESVKNALNCFQPYGSDIGQEYAEATYLAPETCRDEVVELLVRMQEEMPHYDGDPEAAFSAEQNALVAVNAEKYYRTIVRGSSESWNVRDGHMAETLDRLMEFHGPEAKAIVWEHNTHIGDARATSMARYGMSNVGQMVRERHEGEGVVLVGFGSYQGSVIAGESWGAPMREMDVPAAPEDSWEGQLHRAAQGKDCLLIMDGIRDIPGMDKSIGHRAIGVVYEPTMEAYGNYVPSILPERYDAFLFIDRTEALHALREHENSLREPETYPFGE